MENIQPTVSIFCPTYNHANYIRQCLDGIVAQESSIPIEIIVQDDASTDNTPKIVDEYAQKYDFIVPIFHTENHYSQGKNINEYFFKNARGKYLAICEGDDYWTDSNKLKKQVAFLEANPRFSGCFHDVILVDDNSKLIKNNYYQPHKQIFNQEDCLVFGGAYSTCSIMFRSIVIKNPPEWFLKSHNDYTLDLLITEFGDIAHIEENMGAYRIHRGGVWQGNLEYKNLENVIKRYQACLTNPKFKREYSSFFYGKIGELSGIIALHYQKDKRMFKKIKYTSYFIYYTRPRNMRVLKYVLGTLLFPSFVKKAKQLVSKQKKNVEAKT